LAKASWTGASDAAAPAAQANAANAFPHAHRVMKGAAIKTSESIIRWHYLPWALLALAVMVAAKSSR